MGTLLSERLDTNRAANDGIGDNVITSADPVFYIATDTSGKRIETYRGADTSPKEVFFHHQASLFGSGGGGPLLRTRNTDDRKDTNWATQAGQPTHDERYYYANDSRGRPVALVSAEGKLVEQYRYSGDGILFTLPKGDVNGDGRVESGSADFDSDQIAYLKDHAYQARGDLNLDGVVDDVDVSIVNAEDGQSAGSERAFSNKLISGPISKPRFEIALVQARHKKPADGATPSSASGDGYIFPTPMDSTDYPIRPTDTNPTVLPDGRTCHNYGWDIDYVLPDYPTDGPGAFRHWTNFMFAAYYLSGAGGTRSLFSIGLHEAYWGHSAVKRAMLRLASEGVVMARANAERLRSSLACPRVDCSRLIEGVSGSSNGEFNIVDGVPTSAFVRHYPTGIPFLDYGFWLRDWTFSIGGTALTDKFLCSYSAGCDSAGGHSSSFYCGIEFSIKDPFAYPLDMDRWLGWTGIDLRYPDEIFRAGLGVAIRNPRAVRYRPFTITSSEYGWVKGSRGRICRCGP